MPRRKKPIINYQNVAHQFLIEITYLIILCMTGNLYFPLPDPTIDSISDLLDDFVKKLTKAQKGGSQEQGEMQDARKLLVNALRKLGLYLDKEADGDETKLRSTGFLLTHDPIPSAKDTFYLLHGKNPNEIYVVQKAVDKAVSYVFMYYGGENPPVDPTLWKLGDVVSTHRDSLKNMETLKKVWVRACAVLRKEGMQAWTQPLYIVLG